MSKFDDFFFNNYELVKKVYVYSHLNSNFIEREKWEFYYKFFIGCFRLFLLYQHSLKFLLLFFILLLFKLS
jgi:hypothetical protein